MTAYLTLFLTALAAATLFPAQSEAVLGSLLCTGRYPFAALIAIATAGNVLGATINWALGRGIERFRTRPWFPLKPQQLEKAQRWYQRSGKWSLLLSWAPVVGDPLTVVAGILREPFWVFLTLVTIAKLGRYLVLAALLVQWSRCGGYA